MSLGVARSELTGLVYPKWHIYLNMRSRHADKPLPSMTEQVGQSPNPNLEPDQVLNMIPSMRTGAGTVSTDEVPSILTCLGYYATEEDVAAHTHQVFKHQPTLVSAGIGR